jgi:hypothetical protein
VTPAAERETVADQPPIVQEKPAPPPPDPEQRCVQEEAAYAKKFQADQERDDARRKSIADFNREWMGKPLIVKGTVSKVQVQPMGWATLYFQESPDGAFVVCFMAKMFQGFGGKDFSELVGKTVEVRGKVDHPRCAPGASGMQISVPAMIKVQ